MSKRTFAEALTMGTSGGVGGATAGAKFGPYGALAGGLLGAGLGALGGALDGDASAGDDALNREEQGLTNDLLREKLKGAKADTTKRRLSDSGLAKLRGFLSAGFSAAAPSSMSTALKPYLGLGNQSL